MTNWKELTTELTDLLKLDSKVIGVKRLEKKAGLETIESIERPKKGFTYCQLPYLVRKQGRTVGITIDDAKPLADKMQLAYRCLRIQGLAPSNEEQLDKEAKGFAGVWFNDYETASESMKVYPKVSPIEALAMSPLEEEKFEPDYILIYANGGQMTLLMNGLQYHKYELVQHFFTGEGSCSDALPRAVATQAPALCLPCVGERGFGLVKNDELVIALPADRFERTVKGVRQLKANGTSYPSTKLEPGMDLTEPFLSVYPLKD